MTGYQEIMTDPSYAGQIVTFTFPHIGNVGVNAEDDETADAGRRRHGGEVKGPDRAVELAGRRRPRRVADPARPIGVGGVDTRRLTRAIRAARARRTCRSPTSRTAISTSTTLMRAGPGLSRAWRAWISRGT